MVDPSTSAIVAPSLSALGATDTVCRTLDEAAEAHPQALIVSIGVQAPHAAFLAQRALDAGRHVFLFSNQVTLAEERALKRRALDRGLLLMGPDCATAIVGGVGFGFANRIPRGTVGIVGTSGSAIQEVACSLAQLGLGISHALGTGSRDLSPGIDGVMTEAALRLLASDPDTHVLVLLVAGGNDAVEARLCALCGDLGKPTVVRLLDRAGRTPAGGVTYATDLDDAARCAAQAARNESCRPQPLSPEAFTSRAAALLGKRPRLEGRMVGLFAGGALAGEARLILRESGIDATLANCPITVAGWGEDDGNLLVDLGADFYTLDNPHPLVDPRLRCALIERIAADPRVDLLLFDIALGDGTHPDPAPGFATAVTAGRRARGEAPLVVVASVCGCDADPQNASRQRSVLAEAGVQMTHSATSAAALCAALKSGMRGGGSP